MLFKFDEIRFPKISAKGIHPVFWCFKRWDLTPIKYYHKKKTKYLDIKIFKRKFNNDFFHRKKLKIESLKSFNV